MTEDCLPCSVCCLVLLCGLKMFWVAQRLLQANTDLIPDQRFSGTGRERAAKMSHWGNCSILELQDLCHPLAVIIWVLLPLAVCSYCHQVCGKVMRGKYSCSLRERTVYKQRSTHCLSGFLATWCLGGRQSKCRFVCICFGLRSLFWQYREQLLILVLKKLLDKDVITDD